MKAESFFSRVNRSRLCTSLLLVGIFLILLLCNFKTNLVADDYRYCFSFRTFERIEKLSDIIPSMAAHRVSMNGRVAAHALVQLFLLLPLPVFKILNSAFFAWLIYLIYTISTGGEARNNLLLASVFGAVWVLQPEFGQVFLWLDGSVNYLWCAVFCLLWLLPQISFFKNGEDFSPGKQILYVLYSLLVGAYSENSTVALVFMAILFIVFEHFLFRQKAPLWQYASIAALLIGFAFMLFTPGELNNKSAESFSALFSNFLETGAYYLRFWPLILLYFVLLYISFQKKLSMKRRTLSLIFFGGSLAGHFVLSFALYCAGRSTYISLILLLLACGLLFAEQFELDGEKKWLSLLCAVCLCFTAYWGYRGVSDILNTYYHLSFNEQLITEASANGEKDVQLPRIYASTKYSAIEGLPYLNTEDTDDWPNVYMAKYYGVDSVIGY